MRYAVLDSIKFLEWIEEKSVYLFVFQRFLFLRLPHMILHDLRKYLKV